MATRISPIWYLRIYDYKNNKPVVRSLKTTDKNKAIATARVMYMELKGKIDRNEKLQQITAEELIQKYDDTLKEKISPIPMSGGITPDHYKVKRYHLRTWREFLTENKLIDKPIVNKKILYEYLFLNLLNHTNETFFQKINSFIRSALWYKNIYF